MHTFQPFNIEEVDFNAFTRIGKQWALVTAGNKTKYNTMTISWGGLGVLWGKNVALAFIRDSRYTKQFIDEGDFFSVSFLTEKYRDALNLCGSESGRDCDKFEKAGLSAQFRHGIPFVDEAEVVLLCRKMAAVPIDTADFIDASLAEKFYKDGDPHTMYVAEIIETMAR